VSSGTLNLAQPTNQLQHLYTPAEDMLVPPVTDDNIVHHIWLWTCCGNDRTFTYLQWKTAGVLQRPRLWSGDL